MVYRVDHVGALIKSHLGKNQGKGQRSELGKSSKCNRRADNGSWHNRFQILSDLEEEINDKGSDQVMDSENGISKQQAGLHRHKVRQMVTKGTKE